MEQKTEASQAVDLPLLPHLPRAVGYRHTMDNTEGLKGNKPVVVFCATKPNPFGIPGLDYSASFPVTTETLFTTDQMRAYARAALKAQPAPTEAAQGAPTAEQYDEMLRALCCQYGVGGYNSDGLIAPKVAESKLRFALDEQFRVGGELSFNRARGELRDAAAAVVARWDSLDWTLPHTADFIDRLRIALAAPTIPAIPGTKEGA